MNSAENVRNYRARMREAGYRPIQLWVPDTRSDSYQARLQSQIKALNSSLEEHQAVADTESYWTDVDGWEW